MTINSLLIADVVCYLIADVQCYQDIAKEGRTGSFRGCQQLKAIKAIKEIIPLLCLLLALMKYR